jgi:FSR family fosmidomycin resistance protein-like MFS transporter
MADILAVPARHDAQVIGLVGGAHFFSHFYQLVLPPLFPFLIADFGASNVELGAMITVFYASSGLAQTPSGFLVDRFGANRVLPAGLALLAAAMLAIGFAPVFWMTFPLMMLAGFGNSVFHPADYAILTHRVQPQRIARAYSIHTLGGTLGWAAAPVTMLALATSGSWRLALMIVGLAGLAVAMLLVVQRGALDIARPSRSTASPATARASNLALLTARPVILCFTYFTLLAMALIGLQTFLPVTLVQLYGTPIVVAGTAVTAYLVANGIGTLAGGWLADLTPNHDHIVAFGLGVAAALVLMIGLVSLPDPLIITAIAAAGFLAGTTTPSRDMLVRAATPKGSTGKVFGFVYSGLDLGSSLTPPVLGLALDHRHPVFVFYFIAGALVMTVLAAVILKGNSHPSGMVTAKGSA